MKKLFLSVVALCVTLFVQAKDYADYVSPLVGTQSSFELSTGNTYPAISRPWGMNFWTPQTGKMGDGWQYVYTANKIRGFKQTHQPSPWINDYGQFSIMPVTGKPEFEEDKRASWFSHKAEIAKPYYYKVYLAEHDVVTEMVPTERAVMFRFTFPENDSYVVVDACMDCLGKCRQGAIKYVSGQMLLKKQAPASEGIGKQVSQASLNKEKVDTARRGFFTVSALIAASVAVKAQEKKVDGGLAPLIDKKVPKRATPIVPAGALSFRHFAQHCTACQLCVSVCPNQVLRPSGDLKHLMQPEMSYERGYCRPECAKCAEVCPTDAIHLADLTEKSSVQIGHAVWVAQNCIVNTDGVSCGNCARHCPTGAILMVPKDADDGKSLKIPVVNTERCIGCGACENLCPSRPFSAIYVEGHEMHRII